jgi:hypothetical protein
MLDVSALSPENRQWVARDEELRRKAREIAAKNPGVDASGIFHVLWNLERSPSERLRRALRHGRGFFRSQPR